MTKSARACIMKCAHNVLRIIDRTLALCPGMCNGTSPVLLAVSATASSSGVH